MWGNQDLHTLLMGSKMVQPLWGIVWSFFEPNPINARYKYKINKYTETQEEEVSTGLELNLQGVVKRRQN